MSMMSNQVVLRQRSKLVACMTCPLCKKMYREATTISECLHTFCKKCIYQKIVDEELDCCPVCNTYLGVSPLEKLRADHSLEDLRSKIFPSDKKKAKAPADHDAQDTTAKLLPSEGEKVDAPADDSVQDITAQPCSSDRRNVKASAMSSVPVLAKRKERYLSSLETSAPRLSAWSDMSAKKRYPTRRSLPLHGSLSIREPDNEEEDCQERLKSPEALKRDAPCTRQNYTEQGNGKAEFWNPLNHLAEAATKTNCDKLSMQLPVSKSALPDALNVETRELKAVKEHGNHSKAYGNENESNPAPSSSVTPRKPQRGRKKRAPVSEGLHIPAQSVIDANKCDRRTHPIWFSLIAASHQEGYAPLPQIPSCYLRVKDGSVQVSFIKKYLVKKLGLTSEEEVEVSLRGRPLVPTLQLHNLLDLWLRTTQSSQTILASPGSSGQECTMELTYGRKTQLR